jgi:hypothetical protein
VAVHLLEVIKGLGDSSVYFDYMALEIHLMIQGHLTDFAVRPISFSMVG